MEALVASAVGVLTAAGIFLILRRRTVSRSFWACL